MLSTFFTSTHIYAAHYFVSTAGDDQNDGSQQAPLQTIEAALDKSTGGDTIYVLEGVYSTLTNINDYTFSSPVTITPYEANTVVIDGTKRDESERTRAAFSIRNSSNIIIDGFEIRNITTDDDDFFPAGILVRGSSEHITIRNNHIHHIANDHDDGNAHGILIYGNDPIPNAVTAVIEVKRDLTILLQKLAVEFEGNEHDMQVVTSYVPPSNVLSDEGRVALKQVFPTMKVIAALYSSDPNNRSLVQEFTIGDDDIIDMPRISSGYYRNDSNEWEIANAMTTHGVFSHFIHPDDVISANRSQGGWGDMIEEFELFMHDINARYPWLRALSATKAAYYQAATLQSRFRI